MVECVFGKLEGIEGTVVGEPGGQLRRLERPPDGGKGPSRRVGEKEGRVRKAWEGAFQQVLSG